MIRKINHSGRFSILYSKWKKLCSIIFDYFQLVTVAWCNRRKNGNQEEMKKKKFSFSKSTI